MASNQETAIELAAIAYYQTINAGRIGKDGLPAWNELLPPERARKIEAMRQAVFVYNGFIQINERPKRLVAPHSPDVMFHSQSGKLDDDTYGARHSV